MPLARPGPEPTVDHQIVRAVSAGSENPDATGHPVPIRGLYVSYALIDALRSAQLFSAVVPYDGQEKQECFLSGRLAPPHDGDHGGGVWGGNGTLAPPAHPPNRAHVAVRG